MMQAVSGLTQDDAIPSALRAKWREHDMVPLWESSNGALPSGPVEKSRIWRWSQMRPIMGETVRIASPNIVERRVMQLVDKAGPGAARDATCGLMNATLQTIGPGESARPHRHSMNALRFILAGSGAETIVNGKPCAMNPGDLILTPAMTWHEHRHHGGQPAIWLDILDVNLHAALGTAKFEPGPVSAKPETQPDSVYRTGGILPAAASADTHTYSPQFRYEWPAAKQAVDMVPDSPDGSRVVKYVNPVNGGPCMDLIECELIFLPPGLTTAAVRSSATSICSIVAGSGASKVEDVEHRWEEKDIFTVPQHSWVTHTGGTHGAYLFRANNNEVYRRLGLLKIETRATV